MFKARFVCSVLFLMAAAWNVIPARAQFLYAAGCCNISGYTIDSTTGALTPMSGSPFGSLSGTSGAAVDRMGRFLYESTSFGVRGYAIDPTTGGLTEIIGSPWASGLVPNGVTVDPTDRFVYVTAQSTTSPYPFSVYGFTINSATGALTPISGSPFSNAGAGRGLAVEPTGRFLYVVNSGGNIAGYTIDSTIGALTPISGSPWPAGRAAGAIGMDPLGKFVYETNYFDNDVRGYTIDSTTGALTQVTGSPFATGTWPFNMTVDPQGKFAFVSDELNTGNNLSAYTIDRNAGALTPISGSPFAAGMRPEGVAVDPTGKFVYVAIAGANNVSGFKIDSTTGTLTVISGSPFASGPFPNQLAIALPCQLNQTTVAASPSVLWPPNSKLVPDTISATFPNGCSSASCKITAVSSNEGGDALVSGEAVLTGNLTVSLQAARDGIGNSSRVYTITVQCTYGAITTTKTATVTVPHSDPGH
jgi:6-phosphogluconolactonase (cycloisomerase 2 family)